METAGERQHTLQEGAETDDTLPGSIAEAVRLYLQDTLREAGEQPET